MATLHPPCTMSWFRFHLKLLLGLSTWYKTEEGRKISNRRVFQSCPLRGFGLVEAHFICEENFFNCGHTNALQKNFEGHNGISPAALLGQGKTCLTSPPCTWRAKWQGCAFVSLHEGCPPSFCATHPTSLRCSISSYPSLSTRKGQQGKIYCLYHAFFFSELP